MKFVDYKERETLPAGTLYMTFSRDWSSIYLDEDIWIAAGSDYNHGFGIERPKDWDRNHVVFEREDLVALIDLLTRSLQAMDGNLDVNPRASE